jgi:hypothetical protein
VVADGSHNSADEFLSVIGGGFVNSTFANTLGSTVASGESNNAEGQFATVGGGFQNDLRDHDSIIAGGNGNCILQGQYSAITGGDHNTATNNFAAIGGGQNNLAGGLGATLGGGFAVSSRWRQASI